MVPDAVFFIKYLRTLGFSATNVRANYTDLQRGIHETTEYLEIFLRNLLLDEKHELHNRDLHIMMKKVRFCSKMRI